MTSGAGTGRETTLGGVAVGVGILPEMRPCGTGSGVVGAVAPGADGGVGAALSGGGVVIVLAAGAGVERDSDGDGVEASGPGAGDSLPG